MKLLHKIFIIFLCLTFIFIINYKFHNNNLYSKQTVPHITKDKSPYYLCPEYKAEIEQIIDTEYAGVIQKANNCVKEAESIYNKILKNGYSKIEFINLTLISEIVIGASTLDLYLKLMQITQEKYLKIEYNPIATDNPNPIYEYLYPYFKDNNVDTTKLDKLDEYIIEKDKIIQNYIDNINKLYHF